MTTTLKRILSLLCACVLLLSVAGCGGGNTESELTDGNNSTSDSSVEETSSTDSAEASKESSGSETTSSTSSNQSSSSSKVNTTTDNSKVDPAKYKGTTVKFATWSNWKLDVDGPVVSAFEKKYKIKVEWVNVPQADYFRTIQSRIAAGNSPDVFFDNGEFPASLACLQPVSAAKLDLKDAIWDKDFIKKNTFNGEVYLVNTQSNYWSERLCVYYNKAIFKNYGIKTPEQYYAEGNWTWDSMEQIMKDFKSRETRAGYYAQVVPAVNVFYGTLGTGAYYFKNGKVVTGANDNLFVQSTIKLAEWNKAGYLGTNRDDFAKGKAAMILTDAFGLRKNGYWKNMNASNIGFTYCPDWNKTTKAKASGYWRGWGICKGAKNPVAAGIFLKYYLDVNNYDLKNAFISDNAREFFFKLCGGSSETDKQYFLDQGVANITGEDAQDYNDKLVFQNDPTQVQTKISELKNRLTNNVKKINKAIEDYTK